MGKGSKPDIRKRQRVRKLRAGGLAISDIARRTGVSKTVVTMLLTASGGSSLVPVHCCECDGEIIQLETKHRTGSAMCLGCLAKSESPLFQTRLRAYRLANKLSQSELARRAGLALSAVGVWERGQSSPTWEAIVKLVSVLGHGLITVPPL
jgi:transcriptional regulator with XRE-family HTH domain